MVRLQETEFEFIDHSIEGRYYADRDEFIRAAVRLLVHDVSQRKLSEARGTKNSAR